MTDDFFEYFLASAFKQEKADEKVFLKGSIQAQLKVGKSGFTMDVTRAYSIV